MEWLFRIVFGLMGVCVLIWLAEQVKNLLSPRQRCPAVVKERRQQVFPVSVGFKRRDRTQRQITFFPVSYTHLDVYKRQSCNC